MKTPPIPFDSDALRANIATTAQEVVIPERYLPLLRAVDGLHGVRSSLAEMQDEVQAQITRTIAEVLAA